MSGKSYRYDDQVGICEPVNQTMVQDDLQTRGNAAAIESMSPASPQNVTPIVSSVPNEVVHPLEASGRCGPGSQPSGAWSTAATLFQIAATVGGVVTGSGTGTLLANAAGGYKTGEAGERIRECAPYVTRPDVSGATYEQQHEEAAVRARMGLPPRDRPKERREARAKSVREGKYNDYFKCLNGFTREKSEQGAFAAYCRDKAGLPN